MLTGDADRGRARHHRSRARQRARLPDRLGRLASVAVSRGDACRGRRRRRRRRSGELAFAEIVERFAAGRDDVGVVTQRAVDINDFPEHDYSLIDVDGHFALKRERQLDYITSQGCRFRCTFCADPTVYGRSWFGLGTDPRRHRTASSCGRQHRFTDIGFQDETFFTHTDRVAAIADEILRRDLDFTWMATMRADQGARLDERRARRLSAAPGCGA